MQTFSTEPMTGMFTGSRRLILNFHDIPPNTPDTANIQHYFRECETRGDDPRSPAGRQRFNNSLLQATGDHYLIGAYGEDRSSMLSGSAFSSENRTIHMGIDIFCKDLEAVYAPCDGTIVLQAQEKEDHSYGNFMIIRPADPKLPYLLYGHLGAEMTQKTEVHAGDQVARLGDYANNENGGWSRHLHLQMLRDLPKDGNAPIGYSAKKDFPANSRKFPDPRPYFPAWNIKSALTTQE